MLAGTTTAGRCLGDKGHLAPTNPDWLVSRRCFRLRSLEYALQREQHGNPSPSDERSRKHDTGGVIQPYRTRRGMMGVPRQHRALAASSARLLLSDPCCARAP
jgi:hypothetical protein